LKLIVKESGRAAAGKVEIADGFFSRLAGLQFRKELPEGRGLLLIPCGSIHMFFMRFSIDAVMLGKDGRVTAVKRGVAPWSMTSAPAGTHAVLELPEGGAAGLSPGQRLEAVAEGSEKLPPSVDFLAARA